MSDWPSLKEELDRKTVETLERLLVSHAAGELSDRELSLTLNTVLDVVNGLAENDLTEAISHEIAGLTSARKALFRLLANTEEGIVLMEIHPETADVIVTRVNGTVKRGRLKNIEDADYATVLSKVDEVAKRQCQREGWKEL